MIGFQDVVHITINRGKLNFTYVYVNNVFFARIAKFHLGFLLFFRKFYVCRLRHSGKNYMNEF